MSFNRVEWYEVTVAGDRDLVWKDVATALAYLADENGYVRQSDFEGLFEMEHGFLDDYFQGAKGLTLTMPPEVA